MKKINALLLATILTSLFAGCASDKTKLLMQRGWIGGEYVLSKPHSFMVTLASSPGVVGTLPKSIWATQKAAILVTQLGTNTPASLAGLGKGDLILQMNHQPVTRLRDFCRMIDQSEPGTTLALEAYHDGHATNYDVRVGREKFKPGGYFSIGFPTVVHRWDLWPDPGFSLVVIGYEPNPGQRHELGRNHEVYDEGWKAYLGFLELSAGKRVVSQEP